MEKRLKKLFFYDTLLKIEVNIINKEFLCGMAC